MKYVLIILGLLSMLSCKKELEVDEVTFDVNVDKTTIALKDTSKFTFEGNADLVTFWSGEIGKRYEYRDRIEAEGTPILSFRSKKYHNQDNTLKLLVSKNFMGLSSTDVALNKTNIANATWEDISSRAVLPTGTNQSLTSSGNVDLSDYSKEGSPIYFAFKYTGTVISSLQRWEIDSYTLRNNLADGTSYTISNFNGYNSPYANYGVQTFSPGFSFITTNNTPVWFNSTINNVAGIVFRTDATGLTTACDAWAIIGPINLKKVTPDAGTAIKAISQSTKDLKLNYIYPAKGTFPATFIATKANAGMQNVTTKTLTINVQ